MAQFCAAHPALEAFCLPAGGFAIRQQVEPFGMGQICGPVLCIEFGKGLSHSVEPERAELVQGWMIEHDVLFNGSNRRHGYWDV